MRAVVTGLIFLLAGHMATAQRLGVQSPNGHVVAGLYCVQGGDKGEWYLDLQGMIPRISLGLIRSDQELWQDLRFIKESKPREIDEAYTRNIQLFLFTDPIEFAFPEQHFTIFYCILDI